MRFQYCQVCRLNRSVPIPYFQKFPTIGYPIDNSGELTIATDIMERIRIRYALLSDFLIFYTYTVKDGETPEIIAHKLYGSTEFHWIVLLANNIVDPFYDWPMSQENLTLTIKKKYDTPTQDGLVYAYQTVDHYEDALGNTVDETTFNTLPFSERKVVMIYDAEVAANEAKRQIRLLDKQYVSQIDTEADADLRRAEV